MGFFSDDYQGTTSLSISVEGAPAFPLTSLNHSNPAHAAVSYGESPFYLQTLLLLQVLWRCPKSAPGPTRDLGNPQAFAMAHSKRWTASLVFNSQSDVFLAQRKHRLADKIPKLSRLLSGQKSTECTARHINTSADVLGAFLM